MKINYAKILVSLPALYVAAQHLGTDAEQLTSDPTIKAELEANEVLSKAVAEGAAEWRQVEEYADGVKKSNVWNFFTRSGRLTQAVAVLEGTITRDATNAQLADALDGAPATKKLLTQAKAEFDQFLALLS